MRSYTGSITSIVWPVKGTTKTEDWFKMFLFMDSHSRRILNAGDSGGTFGESVCKTKNEASLTGRVFSSLSSPPLHVLTRSPVSDLWPVAPSRPVKPQSRSQRSPDRDSVSSRGGYQHLQGLCTPAIVSWPGLVFVSSFSGLFPWSQVQRGTEGQQCCWEPPDLCIAEWEQQVQVRGLWAGYYKFMCVWMWA